MRYKIPSACPPRARSNGGDRSLAVTSGHHPKTKFARLPWLFHSSAGKQISRSPCPQVELAQRFPADLKRLAREPGVSDRRSSYLTTLVPAILTGPSLPSSVDGLNPVARRPLGRQRPWASGLGPLGEAGPSTVASSASHICGRPCRCGRQLDLVTCRWPQLTLAGRPVRLEHGDSRGTAPAGENGSRSSRRHHLTGQFSLGSDQRFPSVHTASS